MDKLAVLGVAISVGLALALAILFLVAWARRNRRYQVHTITVAELVERSVKHGESIRLNRADADLDAHGRVRPQARDQLPTGVLPKLPNTNDEKI